MILQWNQWASRIVSRIFESLNELRIDSAALRIAERCYCAVKFDSSCRARLDFHALPAGKIEKQSGDQHAANGQHGPMQRLCMCAQRD